MHNAPQSHRAYVRCSWLWHRIDFRAAKGMANSRFGPCDVATAHKRTGGLNASRNAVRTAWPAKCMRSEPRQYAFAGDPKTVAAIVVSHLIGNRHVRYLISVYISIASVFSPICAIDRASRRKSAQTATVSHTRRLNAVCLPFPLWVFGALVNLFCASTNSKWKSKEQARQANKGHTPIWLAHKHTSCIEACDDKN